MLNGERKLKDNKDPIIKIENIHKHFGKVQSFARRQCERKQR